MQNRYSWESSFDSLRIPPSRLAGRILVLAGPSGSGKTTLATKLCAMTSRVAVLRNFTTREARPEDPPGHFCHLSVSQFLEFRRSGSFILCRTSPKPYYGYLLEDFESVLNGDQFALFMFRDSGLTYVLFQLPSLKVVFLEPDPQDAACHSRSALGDAMVDAAEKVLRENAASRRRLQAATVRYLTLVNSYRGERELRRMAEKVLAYLDE